MIEVHGLEGRQGDTAFAFCVLRFDQAVDRDGLVRVLRYVAPLLPDADTFIEEFPEIAEPFWMIGIPWSPPEPGHAVDAQRRLVETAASVGVTAAWFFQTGTGLPSDDEDEDEAEDDEDDDAGDDDDPKTEVAGTALPASTDDGWGSDAAWGDISADTNPVSAGDAADAEDDLEDVERGDDDSDSDSEDDDDGDAWSHGPPPRVERARFAVDGYPQIIDELDWEDFGIAVKLGGPLVAGEQSVLQCFHALWLAPYAGRFRNTDVTIDRAHHAAHFWVDRFAVPSSNEEQVQHLLWIAAKLDEVIPVVHARFGGASMSQKYRGLMGDTSEPFVLGGNPLLAVHAAGGEPDVDAWIAEQQDEWSKLEIATMLRELAIEIVTGTEDGEADEEAQEGEGEGAGEGAREQEAAGEEVEAEFEEEKEEEERDDDDASGGRAIWVYAGEVLTARARAGKLDARAAAQLLPLLDVAEKYEHRRSAVVDVLGALRYRAAVPAMIRILETTPIKDSLDSIGKEGLRTKTATALGAIGDPAAIAALATLVAAAGSHNDEPRPAGADALASCLEASPEPHDVDDDVLAALLDTIRDRNDGELNAEAHFAYGRLARVLEPARRVEAARRLADIESARDDDGALLARDAALALAGDAAPSPELRTRLHDCLTSLDYDHDYTVRNLRVALRVAEQLPQLVDPTDLVWLTRFAEPDVRSRAHALLASLDHAQPDAPVFDMRAARALDDDELVRLIREPHVVGRAALITEAARRELADARGATIAACDDVIARARGDGNLLDPDSYTLRAAVELLRATPLDTDTVALFDRMLRHSNTEIKDALLRAPPADERLIGGMFHVLGEKWGWQESTAKEWLEQFAGTPAYEAARTRVTPDDRDLN